MVCPGMMDVNIGDGSQTGNGRCVITDNEGAKVFARWSCKGYHMVGCKGDIELTGGTMRFKGVTGGGPMVFRSTAMEIVATVGEDSAVETAIGIAFWKGLKYNLR